MKININITLEIEDYELNNFENWLRGQLKVIDLKVLPDTKQLYENDVTFQRLVAQVKTAQKTRDEYINEHNHGKPRD